MSIRPLPSDVIAQIKSSSTITSLNGVIFELVKNCLDACCSRIDIDVDYSRGSCTVEDNGLGISPSEFGENGGLGKLYHSSKLNTSNPTHGGYGTFIASLSALSLLSITSHHHLHHSHNSINMHRSVIVSRQTPAPDQHHLASFEHGTRVTVRNLFGSMPVRVKQRAIASGNRQVIARMWDGLRRDIVSLLLAWPKNISLSIKENGTDQKFIIRRSLATSEWRPVGSVDLFNTCSILSKASYIAIDEKSSWIPVSGSTSNLIVNGAISLIPNATKHIQFLAFGIEPLISQDNCNFLYEEINRWFLNSSFGNQEEAYELDEVELKRRSKDRRYKGDGYTDKELKGGRKSVDRWPMFYINVHKVDQPKHARLNLDEVLDEKRNTLDKILEFLQAIILEFLTMNHFRPKLAPENRIKRLELATSLTNSEILEQSGPTKTNQSCQDTNTISTTSEHYNNGDEIQSQKRARIDTLGTKVKLPSFRQSRFAFDSPFESWSKIKKGIEQPHRKFTDTPESFSTPAQVSSEVEVRAATPLVSKSGQLTRCPFEESQTPVSKATSFTNNAQESDASRDELVVWVNPSNKVKSLVNRRTGLVVSEKKEDRKDGKQLISNSSSRLTATKKSLASDRQPIPWIDDILNRWENPVFAPVEPSIPQISIDGLDLETQEIIHGRHQHCSQVEVEKAFKETSSGLHGRISKDALKNVEIISQVDKKFILANVRRRSVAGEDSSSLLVIIDQHAADERIRIENLLSDFLTYPTVSNIPASASVFTTPLEKPISFDISTKDSQLFRTYMNHFSYWGIIYSVSSMAAIITVQYLPPLITARLIANPNLLLHILRTELYSYHGNPTSHPPITSESTWIERIAHIPKSILELLSSRACRTAIMFNDELGVDECRELVRRLSNCKFPFMCAHGRVSMVPLGDLEMMTKMRGGGDHSHSVRFDQGNKTGSSDGEFGTEWGKWLSQRRNT
ncbi:putative dna mismatch repair protein [Botrytis fragariae]|uniref:Putative dna mismatch repair protein n=1 Tax=Botrytis fragariae TaxID=1964551 RepID=A0A8H6AJH9_9HELO|nr:putative dna mismatch repair protein [Botrytis fragariae]KAF5868504.1 putative dna mismatch repair protein [Botrytis fragariae]